MFSHPKSKKWKASLVELDSDDGGWTRHFKDPNTGQEWTEYFPYHDDRSPSFMRLRHIPDDLFQVMSDSLKSSDKDEWIGVGAYVSGEWDTVEVAKVLSELAQSLSKRALKTFGKYYQAYDNRDVVGMHYTEVESSVIVNI